MTPCDKPCKFGCEYDQGEVMPDECGYQVINDLQRIEQEFKFRPFGEHGRIVPEGYKIIKVTCEASSESTLTFGGMGV